MEWIRKWRINGDQIGRDRKCWPLQSLQTKRICEARTSSLFLLKEEPVSTFLGTEKLALALHVTSAVFERRSGAPYPGEGYVFGISSSCLSVSALTLLHPSPPQPAAPLILCQYICPSLPPPTLYNSLSASLKMFQGLRHPFSLSITPLFHQSLSPNPRWNAAHVWLFAPQIYVHVPFKFMCNKTNISSFDKNDFSGSRSHFSEARTQKRCRKGWIAKPPMRLGAPTHPRTPSFCWKVKTGAQITFSAQLKQDCG